MTRNAPHLRLSALVLACLGLAVPGLCGGGLAGGPLVINDDAPCLPRLLGDWGGLRSDLESSGVSLKLEGLYTYQNVANGGFRARSDDGSVFNGRLGFVLDTGKAGLWPGGFLSARAEGRGGRSVLRRAGATSPVNNAAILPLIPGSLQDGGWGLTELVYAQFVSEQLGFLGGLVNTDGGDANPIAGHLGSHHHFMNTGLLFSSVAAATVPNVALGGGIVYLPSEAHHFKFLVLGSNETAGNDPFERYEGTTFLGEWASKFDFAGRLSGMALSATYSVGQERLRITDDPRVLLADFVAGVPLASKEDSWAVFWNGHHYLSGDETGGWGLFARFGVSDGAPNPVRWNGAAGVGGVGLLPGRERDRWGLGVYHQSFASGGVLSALGIEEETGAELYYNLAFCHGVNLTFDLQVVDSAIPQAGTVVVLGARLGVEF